MAAGKAKTIAQKVMAWTIHLCRDIRKVLKMPAIMMTSGAITTHPNNAK
jgi:hypothetical protein